MPKYAKQHVRGERTPLMLEVLELCGATGLARLLGCTPQNVSRMTDLPPEHILELTKDPGLRALIAKDERYAHLR